MLIKMLNRENIENKLNLINEEKEVLSFIYEFLRDNGEWPGIRTTYQKTGRKILLSILGRKNPSLVFKAHNNDHIEIYGLTFEGIMFSPIAQNDLELLKKYCNFLIDKNKVNPEFREVRSAEVEKELALNKKESEILRNLIQIGGFFGSGGFGAEWTVTVPEDIDDLIELNDAEQYIRKHREAYFKTKEEDNSKFSTSRDMKKDNSVWNEIEKDFGISKRVFGKNISFVKNQFRREIIFRDVEQAYFLAKNDFNKPAVILAGGVIEELLRLFLDNKNENVKNKKFEELIEICQKKGFLKEEISNLASAIRRFRNSVHLAAEKSKKYAISKATASATVALIFTIVNDFQKE